VRQVVENRQPKTNAALVTLLERHQEHPESERHNKVTLRGYLRKHIAADKLGQTPVGSVSVEALEVFYAKLRLCRDRCDGAASAVRHVTEQARRRGLRHRQLPARPVGRPQRGQCLGQRCARLVGGTRWPRHQGRGSRTARHRPGSEPQFNCCAVACQGGPRLCASGQPGCLRRAAQLTKAKGQCERLRDGSNHLEKERCTRTPYMVAKYAAGSYNLLHDYQGAEREARPGLAVEAWSPGDADIIRIERGIALAGQGAVDEAVEYGRRALARPCHLVSVVSRARQLDQVLTERVPQRDVHERVP
jgi:hypothetical protein